MLTNKKNILELMALLQAHGVQKIVACPGTRNVPMVQTATHCKGFTCYPVTDERSAGFFALGMSLHDGRPVAVICTSGTALLNLYPAVAEAYYQQVPLVIVSADKPARFIGQMDGQTLPQPGVLEPLVRRSVNLPEVHTDDDLAYCNRLVNEALLELNRHGKGPVHINVPTDTPLFVFTEEQLPEARVITRYKGLNMYDRDYEPLVTRLNGYRKRMVVVGQMNAIYDFEPKVKRPLSKGFAWVTENLGNGAAVEPALRRMDELLYRLDDETQEKLKPELVITYGGHIVSGRLKQFLRKHPPKELWHVAADGEAVDLSMGALTTVLEMDPFEFLEKIAPLLDGSTSNYASQWTQLAEKLPKAAFDFSAMAAVGALIENLPADCALHLANSSAVRYAQLFGVPQGTEVQCNRGTNGIEGSMSAMLGYATASEKLNFLVTGDLSFFYDMNALWNGNYGSNLRILLLNNGGGELFKSIPGMKVDDNTMRYVGGTHKAAAKAWTEDRGFQYLSAHNAQELNDAIGILTNPSVTLKPIVLEVFTDKEQDIKLLKEYYHQLRK